MAFSTVCCAWRMERAGSPAVRRTSAEFRSLRASRRNARAICSLVAKSRHPPYAASELKYSSSPHDLGEALHFVRKEAARIEDDAVGVVDLQHEGCRRRHGVRYGLWFRKTNIEACSQ